MGSAPNLRRYQTTRPSDPLGPWAGNPCARERTFSNMPRARCERSRGGPGHRALPCAAGCPPP
eukprot:9475796-Lingulodinium_polyedra.AAC.1